MKQSERIPTPLFLLTNIKSPLNLLLMHLIQVLQQHIRIPFLTLVLTNIIAPATHCTSKPARDIRLLADVCDGVKVSADSEDHAARSRETMCVLVYTLR